VVWQKSFFIFTFTLEYGKEPPKMMSICQWSKLFSEVGFFLKGEPSVKYVNEVKINEVLADFFRIKKQTKKTSFKIEFSLLTSSNFLTCYSPRYICLPHIFLWSYSKRQRKKLQLYLLLAINPLSTCLVILIDILLQWGGGEEGAYSGWRYKKHTKVQFFLLPYP
jgi:hypothetical protein